MKNKVEILRASFAIIIAGINSKYASVGINKTIKYKKEFVKTEKFKGYIFAIVLSEMGYPDRTIQELRFVNPDNIDKYNMEYNMLLAILSSGLETSIMTWDELGKALHMDPKLQEAAREVLRNDEPDDKENNNTTDK